MTKELAELKWLFTQNLELGKYANAHALVMEVAKINVHEADALAKELKIVQDVHEEEVLNDEQVKHREEPQEIDY